MKMTMPDIDFDNIPEEKLSELCEEFMVVLNQEISRGIDEQIIDDLKDKK